MKPRQLIPTMFRTWLTLATASSSSSSVQQHGPAMHGCTAARSLTATNHVDASLQAYHRGTNQQSAQDYRSRCCVAGDRDRQDPFD